MRTLSPDGRLLFVTRVLRLLAFGLLSVILALHLQALGLDEKRIGFLLSATLAGDILVSLLITTRADRLGRRRMLLLGTGLMVAAGAVLASTAWFPLLLAAAAIGILSPSGNEIGSFASAVGALAGGSIAQGLQTYGLSPIASYRAIVWVYAGIGVALAALFLGLSRRVEPERVDAPPQPDRRPRLDTSLGLTRSRPIVLRLSGLFAIDAFAGGFVVQSIMAYWFHVRFGLAPAALGGIFFGANVLAGFSALAAARVAARFGLINTMVFTHLPSNVLLILVPLMPNLPLAITVLLIRFSVSQMDVPTRQSYTMAVVPPDERSAAAGVTATARSAGAAVSPTLAGVLMGVPGLLSLPFFISGGLKIVYDLLLYCSFRANQAPEEAKRVV